MAAERTETRSALVRGSTLGAAVILAVVLFAMVNYLAYRHYRRFDWTTSKIYTLSEKSQNVLAGLDRDIDAVVFLSPSSPIYDPINELLDRYAAANPAHFRKQVVDPAKNMLEAQQMIERYKIDRQNVVVVASDDDRRVLDEADLGQYDYSRADLGQAPALQEFKGEQLITSAILELVEQRKPKVLFTSGHSEARLAAGEQRSVSAIWDLLGRDNFEVDTWSSLGAGEVPADTDLVVVASPQTSFLQPELDALSRYLDRGGRLLFLLDPVLTPDNKPVDLGLTDWLARYGVKIDEDIVIDPAQQLPFFGAETLFTASYGLHKIVADLQQTKTPVILPLARSVRPTDPTPDGETVETLVQTTSEGWGETDLAELQDVRKDDADVPGPVSLGVAVSFKTDGSTPKSAEAAAGDSEEEEEATEENGADDAEATTEEAAEAPEPPEARLVVLGDFDFANETHLSSAGNAALLMNTFNWLVQREQLIPIEGRQIEQTRLTLSAGELRGVYWLVLGILPGLSVLCGVLVYLRRRR